MTVANMIPKAREMAMGMRNWAETPRSSSSGVSPAKVVTEVCGLSLAPEIVPMVDFPSNTGGLGLLDETPASKEPRIALLGTLGCVAASVGLGLLAAETISPSWINRPVKLLLALIRSIPLILVAMLMVGAVGLGPVAGILAIAFHATGMLAKFYAEAIEGVDRAPVDALNSAGATMLQRLRFGIWPQMAPVIVRDTIFRFELNLRESLILGIVGAGGVGFYIQTYVRSFQYEKAATLTLVVVGIVLLIEAGNTFLRRRFG